MVYTLSLLRSVHDCLMQQHLVTSLYLTSPHLTVPMPQTLERRLRRYQEEVHYVHDRQLQTK